jgi:hypothetical protein
MMERPVYWQYGDVGHIRRKCRQEYPRKYSPEEKARPKLDKRLEETDKKTTVSSLLSPRYAFRVLDKDGHVSLRAKGRIGDKSCFVTIDTGASVTVARSDVVQRLGVIETGRCCWKHPLRRWIVSREWGPGPPMKLK